MQTFAPLASLSGRVLMAAIFVASGLTKITAYAGTQSYMEALGVPGSLLPLVIATELFAGLAIIAGWQTRLAALALAGFCVVSALLFHADLADQAQFILFMKNLAMAGGFLFLVANGAGDWSLDARRDRAGVLA